MDEADDLGEDGIRHVIRALPRWPVWVALIAGMAVIWPGAFIFFRHYGEKSWVPSAAAASGGWLCVVLTGITAVEIAQILRGRRLPPMAGVEPRDWRHDAWTLVILLAGILLGKKFFT